MASNTGREIAVFSLPVVDPDEAPRLVTIFELKLTATLGDQLVEIPRSRIFTSSGLAAADCATFGWT